MLNNTENRIAAAEGRNLLRPPSKPKNPAGVSIKLSYSVELTHPGKDLYMFYLALMEIY
jgi:hypothetical protein